MSAADVAEAMEKALAFAMFEYDDARKVFRESPHLLAYAREAMLRAAEEEGWRLVSKAPTQRQLAAAQWEITRGSVVTAYCVEANINAEKIWRAMIAATPNLGVSEDGK